MAKTLKRKVMRRIYTVWFIKKATPAAGELAGFALLTNWGLQHVSPGHIMVNAISASNGFNAFGMFFVRAFMQESAAAQFAIVISGILGVIVLRDVWTQMNRFLSIRQKLILPL